MKTLVVLVTTLFLFSCSTWDQEKCLTTDWYRAGVEDASAHGSGNFNPYKRACASEGVSLSGHLPAYEGVLEGMRSWCSFANGFNQGLDGRNKTANCDTVNPAFARGVEEGYRKFRLVQRRKRDDEEREKRYQNETEDFRRRTLTTSKTKECFVDSDCRRAGDCVLNRCRHNNQSCGFSSECEVRGHCREVSEHTPSGERLSLRVCDYETY